MTANFILTVYRDYLSKNKQGGLSIFKAGARWLQVEILIITQVRYGNQAKPTGMQETQGEGRGTEGHVEQG